MKIFITLLFAVLLSGCGCEAPKPETPTTPETPIETESEETTSPEGIETETETEASQVPDANETEETPLVDAPEMEAEEIETPESETEAEEMAEEETPDPVQPKEEPEEVMEPIPEPEVPMESFEVSPDKNLLLSLEADGRFTAFLELMNAYGLTDILTEEKSVTVFAPTDDYLYPLLEDPEMEALFDEELMPIVLLSHVTPGNLTLDQIIGFDALEVYSGVPILVNGLGGEVVLNESASVVDASITAPNGIIHPINTLILPILSPVE